LKTDKRAQDNKSSPDFIPIGNPSIFNNLSFLTTKTEDHNGGFEHEATTYFKKNK
jgi:hypothetical protein